MQNPDEERAWQAIRRQRLAVAALPVPPDAAALGADRVWSKGWPFYPRRRLAGLDDLDGDGVPELRRRLAPATSPGP